MNAKNSQWKVVLVGVAGRGRWAVDVAGADPRLQIVALVDLDHGALEAARQQLGLPVTAIYTDMAKALEETGAEVAIICTPMITHRRLCQIAFDRGVHVLVEKGMAFSWDEALAIVGEADAAGVRLCVAQNYRYLAEMQAIGAILAQPDHPANPGEIFLIDCMHHRYRPTPGTSTYSFAMVWDMGCHHLDLLLSLMGPLRRVSAHSYRAPWSCYEHDANITAFLEFESGVLGNYVLTHDASFTNMRLAIQGTRGVLRLGNDLEGLQFQPLPHEALRNGEAQFCAVPEVERDVKLVLDTFVGYLNGGPEPGISGRRNLETMAACAMLCKAATEQRPIDRAEFS